ncbi:MAG: hypothetical protein NXH72_09960 [Hyphomonadaceae bacterium]|nr:hypothetical protein [Hyphomonadaceae bacterium]
MEPIAVLAGKNRLLLQNEHGWELLAWRDADLVGPDQWRLRGLLRGLNGSPIGPATVGSQVVLVDVNLLQVGLTEDEIGVELFWQAGMANVQTAVCADRAGRPWRVGHLRAEIQDQQVQVSWTARGEIFSNNWERADVSRSPQFDVRTYQNADETRHPTQSVAAISFPLGEYDAISVAEIGADQRRGEWVSIQLPSP